MKLDPLHAALHEVNRTRLRPTLPNESTPSALRRELESRNAHFLREQRLLEAERRAHRQRAAAAPTTPADFVRWFEDLKERGPGQNDALFPWLADEASLDEMKWFLAQEVAGEAGFEDLVALTQVQLPVRSKLELARNYWDEMGRGHAGGMHGPMLAHLARALDLPHVEIVTESVALGNLMMAFACNRPYAYHSIGALGVIELTAPGRAACVNRGLKRLGIHASVRRYFAVHSTLDVEHSKAWNAEVLTSLVAERPEVASAIAEGALMRLEAGARCFERYRSFLWGTSAAAAE